MVKNQEIYTKTNYRESVQARSEGGHFYDREIHIELIRKHGINVSNSPILSC